MGIRTLTDNRIVAQYRQTCLLSQLNLMLSVSQSVMGLTGMIGQMTRESVALLTHLPHF